VALRAPKDEEILAEGVNIVPLVHAVLDKMAVFSNSVRSGEWKGYTGKPIRNIINIGIGGSDLGPVMAYEAMRHYSQRDLNFRFVSNVDVQILPRRRATWMRRRRCSSFRQDVYYS